MLTVGLDVHQRVTVACVLGEGVQSVAAHDEAAMTIAAGPLAAM